MRKVRQISASFVVFFLLVFGFAYPSIAETTQKFLILENYPWAFYDKDRVAGVAVEWLEALSAKHNLALTPVITSFQRGVEHVKRGEIDFMIAPESPRFRALGTPVFQVLTVPMVLVARPGLSVAQPEHLMALQSLGVVAGLQVDEITIEPMTLPPVEEVQLDSALRRMAAGRLDALIVSKFALMAEAARQDLPIHRWPQRSFGTVQLALFIGKGAPDNPQTEAVMRAIRQARDARSYLPYIARYLSP